MPYTSNQSINIDHTQCGSSDSTAWPFLFSSTILTLRTIANGGDVTNVNGYDIIFTSDSSGLSLLNWEVESYDPVGGTLIAWVNIPTLSHTSNTVIYIFYGNSSITTFQGNVNGTWDSSFKVVTHYGSPSVLSLTDSTSNARNGTNSTIPILATTGIINGAGASYYTGGGHQAYVTYSDTGLPSGSSDRTVSFWLNLPSGSSTNNAYAFQIGTFLTNHEGFSCSPYRAPGIIYDGGTAYNFTFTPSFDTWYYIVVTFTGGTLTVYINGSSVLSTSVSGLNTVLPGTMYTFETDPAVFNSNINSLLDEFRVANVARSLDYQLAEYNNQIAPGSFYTLGVPPAGGGIIPVNLSAQMQQLTGGLNG